MSGQISSGHQHSAERSDTLAAKSQKKIRRLAKVAMRTASAPTTQTDSEILWVSNSESEEAEPRPMEKPNVFSAYHAINMRHIELPPSYKLAMASAHATEWRAATIAEYDALTENDTWDLVPPPTRDIKCLTTRWVLTVKYLANGDIERFKARLVVKGYLQRYGFDYDEIFSPVVRMEVLRTILALAAALDWEIHQMDVKTAFLNGELDETIHIRQPEGFVVPGKENWVCRLKKSLYGLKQAPRVWHKTLSTFFCHNGFKQLVKDRCVFIRNTNGIIIIVSAYVDDLLIITNSVPGLAQFKEQLNARFKMSDLGEAKFILGWHIHRDRKRRIVFVNQHKYAATILERFQMTDARATHTPLETNNILKHSDRPTNPDEVAIMAEKPYRQVVGSLMYLMVSTRPDLATVIRETSQHLTNPGMPHWHALTRALRYLKGTTTHGIVLGGTHAHTSLRSGNFLSAYCDADYANSADRRSITGYVTMMFGNSPISWRSRKQALVTLSTTEAEFIALAAGVQEVKYLKMLLGELDFHQTAPVTVHEDNEPCVRMVKNPEAHGRTKHIDIKYYFVQEAQINSEIMVTPCDTQNMTADIMTKPLAGPQFQKLRHQLGVHAYNEVFKPQEPLTPECEAPNI